VKVVFLEDVADVAEVGQVKDVADGYARNYLIPHKLAAVANSAASNILKEQLKKKERKMAQLKVEMTDLAASLEGKEISITAKTGDNNRLFGSVTSADIAEEIKASLNIEVDKKKIEIAEPIKTAGSHVVTLKLFKKVAPKITVNVIGELVKSEAREEKKAAAAEVEVLAVEEATVEETVEAAAKETVEAVAEPVEEAAEETKETE